MKLDDGNYEKDYYVIKNTSVLNCGEYYWLASRAIEAPSFGTEEFYVRSYTYIGRELLWFMNNEGVSEPHSPSSGLRPVITLKSSIQTSGGDGSKSTPYKLVAQ